MNLTSVVIALIFVLGYSLITEHRVSAMEFKRLRGPGDATTLRQYYRQINALSADPELNDSMSLFT